MGARGGESLKQLHQLTESVSDTGLCKVVVLRGRGRERERAQLRFPFNHKSQYIIHVHV